MDVLLNWLWQGSIVAIVLTALLRLLERARANVRYLVCWAALLLVIVLPVVSSIAVALPQPRALAAISTDVIVTVPTSWWTSTVVMLVAWAGWASIGVIRLLRAMAALRRARAAGRAFPAAVEAALPHWRRVRDEGRLPSLVLSDAVTSAAVLGGGPLGCGAPVIAVAPSLVATLEADELDRVLIHEWAHVQRRDDLVNILQVALRIVAGWHPAVWWIERRLHVEREMACDELTVAITGSPKSYAECLVKLAELRGAERTMLPVPAALRASGLRARVTRIVSRRPFIAPTWSRGIAAAIVSALCVVSLAAGGQRLVGAAALALPFESIGAPRIRVVSLPPMALATSPASSSSPAPPASSPQLASASAPPPPRLVESPPLPPAPAASLSEAPPAVTESTATQATAAGHPDVAVAPETPPTLDAQTSTPPAATIEQGRSPWTAVADKAAGQGVAIGRTSKGASVATAGLFTRFARRVAGAF